MHLDSDAVDTSHLLVEIDRRVLHTVLHRRLRTRYCTIFGILCGLLAYSHND